MNRLEQQQYQQQQLYLNQQRRKQQPISNVTGDKGNDTIIDVDEYEDIENGSSDKRNGAKEQPGEQGPDYFDNIDNIDVNIEETFSANQ